MIFQFLPVGGVDRFTPDGHYLDIQRQEAQIIAVGCFMGEGAYTFAIPRFEFVSATIMPSAPDQKGRYWDIRFRYSLMPREQEVSQ